MIDVISALDALKGEHVRGYTFVGALGPGQDRFMPFDELRAEVARRAAAFGALGLRKGDRVALVLPEPADFVPTFLAALWAGLVPVPLYPPPTIGKLESFMAALVTILNAATPRVIVTNARVADLLSSVIQQVASVEKVVRADELTSSDERAPEPRAPEDIAFIQFTSGSTSMPKGVIVTHGSLAANAHAIMFDGLESLSERDVGVSWLPLYHDMGLIGFVLAPIVARVSVVFIPTLSFIRNATLWLDTISRYKGTISFAPNFAYALATKRAKPEQIARWDLSHMRAMGCGAEPVNPDTIRRFVEAMAPAKLKPEAMIPAYGMAEATLAVTFVGLDEQLKTDKIDSAAYHAEHRARPATEGAEFRELVSCGRPFPGHELSIQDENGNALGERMVGEICFRGPSVAAGYWENPDATKAAGMDKPGQWLRTGDLGYMAGGELYVSGRIKDILILNGRNYYPQSIEWLVEAVPGVREGSAVVFSRPGAASEEMVVAYETRENDLPKLAEAIRARVSSELSLSVADLVAVSPGALPKTSSGKPQRRKTREQYLAGTLSARKSPAQ